MRKADLWTVRLFGLGLALAAVLFVCGAAWSGDLPQYVPNEYIIHVLPGTSLDTVQALVAKMGGTVVAPIALPDTYLIRLGRIAKTEAYTPASGRTNTPAAWVIDRIQPNFISRPVATPNDPLWDKLWGMTQIKMPQAWDIVKGSPAVIVAVNDTGVAPHPDIVDRLLPGYDAVDDDYDPMPVDGPGAPSHGTHCAGTIAAQGNNSIGVCGVCWDGVRILPVRVLGPQGGSSDMIVSGLDFAMKNGAQVVSMSYGKYARDSAELQKLRELAAQGIILVAAAGNDNTDVPHYPSGYSEVVSVAATGPQEAPAYYSNYGKIDIAAPGGDLSFGQDGGIWSTVVSWSSGLPVYGYESYQGTSMACPHISGAAALLLSYGVAPADVMARLYDSARPPKSGGMNKTRYGAGIADVRGALTNTRLRIVSPGKGANTDSKPSFRISMRNISLTSIRVYFDYADLDGNGVPDNPAESQIINSTNVNYFWNAASNTLEFTWLDPNLRLPQAAGPLSPGAHSIYVSGAAATGGESASDWAVFFVVARQMNKGIHLVSFPYALTDRLVNTPASILNGAKFGANDRPRSTMIRWIAAPRAAGSSAQIGYQTYVPGTLTDLTWATPYYTTSGTSAVLGGGYFWDSILGQKQFAFPAGSGFWLILPEDVGVNEIFTALEAQSNYDGSKGFEIPLYKGWNLIGNPYAHQVPWRAALFTYQGQTKTLLDAESAGWVRSSLYGYGGSTVGYVRVSDRDMLQPFAGYWILAQVGGIGSSDSLTLNILP